MKYAAAAALGAFAPFAIADGLDYDYLEAGYLQGEIDDSFFRTDFDGWELRGSMEHNDWLLLGGYEELTAGPLTSFGTLETRFISSFLRVGGGYRFMLGEHFALAPSAGFLRGSEEIERDGFCAVCDFGDQSDTDTGYFVNLDFRAQLLDNVEAEFEHRFTNVFSNRLNDWRLDVRYHFTPQIAVSAGYRDYEGDTATGVTLRWHY